MAIGGGEAPSKRPRRLDNKRLGVKADGPGYLYYLAGGVEASVALYGRRDD